jgi:beta-ribofuranosylaminobenzene 5'-phosphate synthase
MGVLPALMERNLSAFAAALEKAQAVGWKQVEIQAQEPVVHQTMAFLRENGAYGVAMSSWGPTLAAFADDAHALKEKADLFLNALPEGGTTCLTRACNSGATITRNT